MCKSIGFAWLSSPGSSVGKESACNAGDLGSIPGLGRSPGEGKSYSLQYSGLENLVDCIVHGVTKSWTRLSDFHFSLDPRGRKSRTKEFVNSILTRECKTIRLDIFMRNS